MSRSPTISVDLIRIGGGNICVISGGEGMFSVSNILSMSCPCMVSAVKRGRRRVNKIVFGNSNNKIIPQYVDVLAVVQHKRKS